ncbi:MAG: Cold-shock DEAD-box protein [Pseudomonadota bacterium]
MNSLPSRNSDGWETFDELPAQLREVLSAQGITRPTVIQSKAIPAALSGRDVLAQSSTGSGKTLAFSLPVALKLKKHGGLRALILTPTRELATQVATVLDSTLSSLRLRTLAITGGSSYSRQKRALHEGVDIVVATPGRMNDLLAQGSLSLEAVQCFVLDEVDQMLDFGFKEDLEKIRAQLPESVQTLFFSATLSHDIRSIARKLLKNPLEVNIVSQTGQSPSTIRHAYLEVRGHAEHKALINALLFHNPTQAMIFCKTRQECADLSGALQQRGFDAAALHGDLTQVERNQTLEKFREKKLKFLIATNVAARGIDVQDLPLVVNFNVPFDVESYTHRVGRTGRNGAEGQAWTIVTPSSCRAFESIMRQLKLKPQLIAVPNCAEVINRCTEGILQALKNPVTGTKSKTISKALERTLSLLSSEEKDAMLQEILARQLEKLEVYYHDDLICHKPIVRLNGDGGEAFSSKEKRFGGRREFSDRDNRKSRGGFKPGQKFNGPGKFQKADAGKKDRNGRFGKPPSAPVARKSRPHSEALS